jgi:hypothetical protein
MKCARDGCPREGTHHLELTACARGLPPVPPNIITGFVEIALCRDHAGAATPEEWVRDENWEIIEREFNQRRLWPLDRSTVRLKPVRISEARGRQ